MPENTFLRYFANEPVVLAADAFTCPQSTPATTKVSAEGRANYGTLRPNAAAGYGMTGLMAMATWNTSCYGQVMPGYVFLFPAEGLSAWQCAAGGRALIQLNLAHCPGGRGVTERKRAYDPQSAGRGIGDSGRGVAATVTFCFRLNWKFHCEKMQMLNVS